MTFGRRSDSELDSSSTFVGFTKTFLISRRFYIQAEPCLAFQSWDISTLRSVIVGGNLDLADSRRRISLEQG